MKKSSDTNESIDTPKSGFRSCRRQRSLKLPSGSGRSIPGRAKSTSEPLDRLSRAQPERAGRIDHRGAGKARRLRRRPGKIGWQDRRRFWRGRGRLRAPAQGASLVSLHAVLRFSARPVEVSREFAVIAGTACKSCAYSCQLGQVCRRSFLPRRMPHWPGILVRSHLVGTTKCSLVSLRK